MTVSLSPLLFPLIEETQESAKTCEPLVLGYGSSAICMLENLQKGVLTLTNAIRRTSDPLLHHDLFVFYTYLCAMFSFGLRPRNRPVLPILIGSRAAIV